MATDPHAATKSLATRVEQSRALLVQAVENHAPVALASAMGAEDMVLIDQVAGDGLPVEIFVLDTGRLHRETLSLITETRERYSIAIKIHHPKAEAVAAYVRDHGRDGFYDSIEARKACCGIRKVEPLGRALAGFGAWITGLRRGQSITRAGVTESEWDEANGLWKFNPLADWSSDEIWRYVKDKRVPYNPLYDQGFASIGCAPCSRAIAPGENERAGRWWWETPESRECGLHVADDRLVRTTASRS
ncbi:MAG: phosphoadenylyl-sulfate reductase [Alphaproteobacteria bacterium]